MSANIRKNYIYQIIYRLSICILPLVVTPYIARVLGVENNGLYAFSSTVATYFILLGKLGLENYGSRSIAFIRDNREERSKTFWSIYALQIITSLLALFFYLAVVITFLKEHLLIYLMQLIYVISVLFDVSWFFYGIEEFRLTTIRSLITRALLIVAVFLFVASEGDLWIFTGLMSMSFLLEQLLLLPFLSRYIDWIRPNWATIAQHIRPNLRLFVPLLAISINNWLDKLMLGIIDGTAAVAFYNYAESIINLPKGIVLALGTVMLPALSHKAAQGITTWYKQTLASSMGMISFIACALCFGIAGMAPVFVPFFLGPDYYPTILLTIELALVMIPLSIIDVLQTQYLIPFQQETVYIRSMILGALVNIILNSLLIPMWGASGAVIGTIGASLAICIYQLSRVQDIFSWQQLMQILIPFLICGLLEFLATFALGKLSITAFILIVLQIGVGGIVYLLACWGYILVFRPTWLDLGHLWKGMRSL